MRYAMGLLLLCVYLSGAVPLRAAGVAARFALPERLGSVPESFTRLRPDDSFPQPPTDFGRAAVPFEARGLYVTANSAGVPDRLAALSGLTGMSGINALVIDLRTEDGVTAQGIVPFADGWGASQNAVPDMRAVVEGLNARGICTVARVVTFLDGYTHAYRPELYIHNPDGSLWEGPEHNGGRRYPWLNPYNRAAWDYVLEYAMAAARLGFREVQFDYVRFAATARLKDADLGDTGGMSRCEIIAEFLRYAKERLAPYGVAVSADVYGTVVNSDVDADIVGQDYAMLARVVDVLCPMIYPSHFAEGTFGIDHPDMNPYDMTLNIMKRSAERLAAIPAGEPRARVRPWLQDFTASWVTPHLDYGADERAAQIRAVYDAGGSEWLLWDPANRYEAEGVLLP